jgi:hypothetical protein
MENFEIFIESAKVGNRLVLKVNQLNKTFKTWSIEDSFNGKTRFHNINDNIYGFFVKDNFVDLYLLDSDDKVVNIKNVKLQERT